MLKLKFFLPIAFGCFAVLLTSCSHNSVDPEPSVDDSTNYSSINSWVYELMDDAYFWQKYLPASSKLDYTQNPTNFFEKLIYQREQLDRFSLITDDIDKLQAEFNGVSKIFGISYLTAYTSSTKTNIALFISLVVKDSPAEKAGLKRGDIILKVNGQALTSSNYSSLISGNETATFSLGTMANGVLTESGKQLTMTRAEVTENPVAFSTIVDKSQYGKKIGYVVYTQFIPGNTSDAEKYDNELRQLFANFSSQKVNELVLDLRFNPGGYISSATTLASLIGKNISSKKIFYKEQWNDRYQQYLLQKQGSDALNHAFQDEVGNVGSGISRVFVLTSNGTASASELVINGLKPYMDVITVGEHTYGKNLFGSLIEDDLKRWKWGMYIMLGQTANANGESSYGTKEGIAPTYEVKDTTVPFYAFGDDNETLFKKVLEIIGIPASTTSRTLSTSAISSLSGQHFNENELGNLKPMILNRRSLVLP